MTQTIKQALKNATLYNDDYSYRFIKLPANAITAAASVVAQAGNPFTALLVDKDEVTLMLEDEDFHQYQKHMIDYEVSETHYRLITFDIVLDSSLVGFMAVVSAKLADAGISIMPFAAFSRDHIFVPAADYDKAIQALKDLQNEQ